MAALPAGGGGAAPGLPSPDDPARTTHPPAAVGAEAGAAARLQTLCRSLALAPSAPQTTQLLDFMALLQRWNTTHNLTALRDPEAAWTHHLADCLAVMPALARQLPPGPPGRAGPTRVLDVGSGGGLPGVVIAVMRPDLGVTCVDSVGKKVAFLRQVAGALALPNLHAAHARVETLPAHGGHALVVSRAFASLPDFVRLTRPLLAPGGAWMAMKGRRPDDEIAALPADTEVFHVEPITVPGLEAERCLVWMRPRGATRPDSPLTPEEQTR